MSQETVKVMRPLSRGKSSVPPKWTIRDCNNSRVTRVDTVPGFIPHLMGDDNFVYVRATWLGTCWSLTNIVDTKPDF